MCCCYTFLVQPTRCASMAATVLPAEGPGSQRRSLVAFKPVLE